MSTTIEIGIIFLLFSIVLSMVIFTIGWHIRERSTLQLFYNLPVLL
jgi:hypothetical protein